MAQASPTICSHNAPGQTLVAGRPTKCRQCGAQIEPTSRTGSVVGQATPNAVYPGDANSSSQAWAFAQ